MPRLLTPSNFQAAKPVIRKALDEAEMETLLSLLEAARAGKVPYAGSLECANATRTTRDRIDECGCLVERLTGDPYKVMGGHTEVSAAYGNLVPHSGLQWVELEPTYNLIRQRVLIPMVRAAIKRRKAVTDA